MQHKKDPAAVEKAATTAEAPIPAFLKRDDATIDALVERANKAEHGGPPLNVTDKLALELAMSEGLITAGPEETARDLIAQGLRESDDRRVENATALVDKLEKIATEVAGVRVKPSWWSLKEKLAAEARTRELRAEFDQIAQEIFQENVRHLIDARHDAFKAALNDHVRVLKAAFDRPFRES